MATVSYQIPPVFVICGGLACGIVIAGILLALGIILIVALSRRAGKKAPSVKDTRDPPMTRKDSKVPGPKPREHGDRVPKKKKSGSGPIICVGTVAIIVVMIIVISAFTGVIVLLGIRMAQEDPGEISIDSFSPAIINPLTTLRIAGSGFDPDGSAISVVFTNERGIPYSFPASYADRNSVEIVVPPSITPSGPVGGIMDIKVVQVSDERVMTSNTLEGLEVRPMLEVGPAMGTGNMTRLYLSACLDCVDAMIANRTGEDLTFPLLDYKGSLMDLRSQLENDIAEGSGYLNMSGNSVNLTNLDMIILNIVKRTNEMFPEVMEFGELTRAGPVQDEEYKRRVTDDVEYYRSIALKQHELGSMLLKPAAQFVYGLYSTTIGLAGGAGMAMALSYQVALAVGTSWLVQLSSGEMPTATGTARTALETVTEYNAGVPIVSIFKEPLTFLTAVDDAMDEAERFREGEPRGGVVLTDMEKMRPPFADLNLLYKEAPGEHARRLLVSGDRSSVPFEDAIPPIPPGRISYSGNFDGSRTFYRTTTCPQCGPVVSQIDYYVVGSIELTGTVDDDGRITGSLSVSGHWDVSGDGGCPHFAVQPSGGPLTSTQSISGSTSGFRARSDGGDMMGGISGTMDPDSVYGELTFQGTDGAFSVQYVLTSDD